MALSVTASGAAIGTLHCLAALSATAAPAVLSTVPLCALVEPAVVVPPTTLQHGMEDVRDYSDGYAEAWFLPDATDLVGYNEVSTTGAQYIGNAGSTDLGFW